MKSFDGQLSVAETSGAPLAPPVAGADAPTSPPDVDPALAPALRLGIVRSRRRLSRERVNVELSDAQLVVLGRLQSDGPSSLGQLAAFAVVQPPSMHRTVQSLVDAGYAERTRDAKDARIALASITPAGRAVVEDSVRRRDEWLDSWLRDLSPADRQVIARAADLLTELAER